MTKARILLKADAAEGGDGWSDSQIATALDISAATVARTRRQLVEEGFEAVLKRKLAGLGQASHLRWRQGGQADCLGLFEPPKGRKRWTLKLLEGAVVELNIVDRASDNTIGRTLKKTFSSPICKSNGSSRRMPTPPS